ncbi:hypothetical protein [Tropicimonas marinistellae]|uniref:hypothetical protein n=1 Tax=Tropicimonas marinistellae TaxID=1739787 RepID=UPI000833C455|nr:hypothetical protein [Tropicimonas marinistellae]
MAVLPDLQELASEHFTYADLCHCSDTWRKTRIENVPQEPETYHAISELCEKVLEPIAKEFGQIELTYGFAGPALTRKIRRRISPQLDQHAGHERRASGEFFCPRLGQAADFWVPGVSSIEVARVVVDALPFDRVYLYGPDRPMHVSIGPQDAGVIFEMRKSGSRLIPRALKPKDLASGG